MTNDKVDGLAIEYKTLGKQISALEAKRDAVKQDLINNGDCVTGTWAIRVTETVTERIAGLKEVVKFIKRSTLEKHGLIKESDSIRLYVTKDEALDKKAA